MESLPFAATTPTRVSQVGIKARDARGLADYYRRILGLAELSAGSGSITLGVGERPLMVIDGSRSAKEDDPRAAGLYHTAFLLPSRPDLARWVRFAVDERIATTGASDHFVSEAVYLTDPEGNGIEIYADRPKAAWAWDGPNVRMATERLDVSDLLGELKADDFGWKGAPQGSLIGHVHLRVGDAKIAEDWWNSEMGFDTVARYGGAAVFLSTGGYHHHIGANAWQSKGAGPRDDERSGLMWVELESETAAPSEKRDPWGTIVRTVAAKAA